MLYCQNCSAKNKDTAKFCLNCGKQLEKKKVLLDKELIKKTSFFNLQTIIKYWYICIFILVTIVLITYLTYDINSDGYIKSNYICSEQVSIQKSLNSTVKITTDFGTGSGFFISPNQILTNNHVVEGHKIGDEVTIQLVNDYTIKGKIIGGDPIADLAIIQTKHQNSVFLTWDKGKTSRQGADLWVLGYPLSGVEQLKGGASITKGSLSAIRTGHNGEIDYVQTDASVKYGNSGGPIINKCGSIIAISSSAYKYDDFTDPIAFGISGKSAKPLIEKIINGKAEIVGTQPSFQIEGKNSDKIVSDYYSYLNDIFAEEYDLDTEVGYRAYHSSMLDIYNSMFTIERQKGLSYEDWVRQWNYIYLIETFDSKIDKADPHIVNLKLIINSGDYLQATEQELKVVWNLDYSLGALLLDKYEAIETGDVKQYVSDERLADFKEIKVIFDMYVELKNKDIPGYPSEKRERFKNLLNEIEPAFNRLYDKIEKKEVFDDEDYKSFQIIEEKIEDLSSLAEEIIIYIDRENLRSELSEEIKNELKNK